MLQESNSPHTYPFDSLASYPQLCNYILYHRDSLDKMFIFKQLSNLLKICQLFNTKISSVKLIYNIYIKYSKHVTTHSVKKNLPCKSKQQQKTFSPKTYKSIQNLYIFQISLILICDSFRKTLYLNFKFLNLL